MSLSRDRSHSFPADPPHNDWMECEDCGMPLPPGSEPRSLCSGMNQRHKLSRTGSLDRSTPLSPVSDSNSEGSPTQTALASWVREQPCMLSGQPGHYCEEDVVAHHVRSRGSGHGDWRVTNDGRIVGNLVPLDYFEHQRLHDVGRRTWEQKHGVDLEHAARRYGEEFSGEPPQRVRDRAQLREAESE